MGIVELYKGDIAVERKKYGRQSIFVVVVVAVDVVEVAEAAVEEIEIVGLVETGTGEVGIGVVGVIDEFGAVGVTEPVVAVVID